MTLRQKTLILIGSAILSLILVLYFVSSHVLMRSFDTLEEQDARQKTERVLKAFSDNLNELIMKSADWAVWDDTYRFIQDGNRDYIQSNLPDPTFIDLRLNFIIFIDPSGRIVHAKGFDLKGKTEIPLSENLKNRLLPASPLLKHPDVESLISGFVLLPEGPLLLASRPIVTSERKGPVRGTILFARFMDSEEIRRLSELTKHSLSVYRLDDPNLPSDVREVSSGSKQEPAVRIRTLDDGTVAGYLLLDDLYGRPGLMIRTDMPREIHLQGLFTRRYFLISLVSVGLLFGLVSLLLLGKMILSPLSRLNADLHHVQSSADPAERVRCSGNDELADLASSINRMLDAIQQKTDELARSNKELEHFASIASHDLQEPLRKVMTFGERLKEKYEKELGETGKDYLHRMQQAAKRMSQLIQDLLQFSRVSRQKRSFETVNLSEITRDVLTDLETRLLQSGGRVEIWNLPTVKADSLQMRQLFQNLISNALKYHKKEEPPRIKIWSPPVDSGGDVEIRFQDNGIGFNEKYADRIFQPFQRLHTRSEFEGTGMGLTICQKIVSLHGGKISARSEPGNGATFIVRLPSAPPS